MNSIETAVRIGVPADAAFEEFTRFENYPEFMSVVDSVSRDPANSEHVRFAVSIASVEREYDVEVRSEPQAGRLHWSSIDSQRHSGVVIVTPEGAGCELKLSVQYQVEGAVELVGDRLGLLRSQVDKELKRFARYAEEQADRYRLRA
jgi:uncharacterized membrane protein